MTRVAGIDVSLTGTGIALSDGTPCLLKSSSDGPKRFAWVRDAVLSKVGHGTDLAVIEGYSHGSKFRREQMGEIGGIIRLALWEAGIPYVVCPPPSLKVYATGVGNCSKDDVLLAAVRRLDYQGKSKDEADALWLRAVGMGKLGNPVVDLPQTHTRALDKLEWVVIVNDLTTVK